MSIQTAGRKKTEIKRMKNGEAEKDGPVLSPDVLQGEERLGVNVIHDASDVDVGEADLPVVELDVAGRLCKMESGTALRLMM